ncbi:MAG: AAA family ATPase, partial [Bacteroidales bacterium]|nr:AAA family ATPase [Bacteroidales bacterium]
MLIDALDVEFPEGLVIISGQTGAGKSILLGALSLLTGAKADASVISEGAASCVVEGEFSCADPAVDALLAAADVEPDGGNLLVRRVVNATGRSRAFVNDCPVQAALLSELAGRLVDIHSQHDTLLLRDRRYQLSVLDHYAGNGELLQSCGTLYRRVKELERELAEVTEQERRTQAEGEFARASLARLDAAKLVEGEWEELEQEHARLANAEQIKEEIYRVTEADLDAGLKEAGKALSRLARFVPAAADWEQRLSSARLEVADILAELEALDARTDLSGDALERVESRMATLRELMRKHGCETPEALIAVRDALRGSLGEGTALAERREALAAELAAQQR